jgi:hypothetical protein
MTQDPLYGVHPSSAARGVFAYLHRRGGCMRLGPLLRGLAMDRRLLIDAVNELKERYWITIVWREAAPGTPEDEPRPLDEVERLTTTRFGRRKYRTTWPLLD